MIEVLWPLVALTLVLIINYRYGQYVKLLKPLGQQQYDELVKKLASLQNQVSNLSIQKGMRDD